MKESTYDIIDSLISRYSELYHQKSVFAEAVDGVVDSFWNGGKLLVCGNGGSSSDAQHIVGELMKSFKIKRRPPDFLNGCVADGADYFRDNIQAALPAISLSAETSLTSAICNDMKPDLVFAQQVAGYGQCDDVLIAISTSGNSSNVVNACKMARILDMYVIGLMGETNGAMAKYCDVVLNAPSSETHEVQEYHVPIYHMLCMAVENELFGVDDENI